MDVHSPPAKLSRFSEPPGMAAMQGGPSVGLGLGLGSTAKYAGFTFLQLQEFEHQALIYKYMAAGVAVPFHLVLPIWKSVANSSLNSSALYKHYPSWLGYGGSSLCFDYRSSMEPEPGRCRRTDGKKWRCSKDVVPEQKYCERHMHRGRQRSRKPVEGSVATPTHIAPITPTKLLTMDSNTHLSISIPGSATAPLVAATTTTTAASTTPSLFNSNGPLRSGFSPSIALQ